MEKDDIMETEEVPSQLLFIHQVFIIISQCVSGCALEYMI